MTGPPDRSIQGGARQLTVIMAYRSYDDTAAALVLLLDRNETTRARITKATLREISGRRTVRASFLHNLFDAAADCGVALVELETDCYAIVRISALEEADALSLRTALSAEELGRFGSDPRFFSDRIEWPAHDAASADGEADEDAQLPL